MQKSYEELVDILSELLKHPENEYTEFKRAKNNFEIDKLGKYFSAMSNEATLKNKQYGWIIFGIDDKTHEVLGTNYCIENNFTRKIIENATINDLDEIAIKVAREQFKIKNQGKEIAEEIDEKKDNLIEGRFPRVYISSNIAQIVNEKAKYIDNKGLDNRYYKDYIINYLMQFEKATRQDINEFIYPKLPSTFAESDKDKRVTYLLTSLRKQNKITNIGSDTKSIWILKND